MAFFGEQGDCLNSDDPRPRLCFQGELRPHPIRVFIRKNFVIMTAAILIDECSDLGSCGHSGLVLVHIDFRPTTVTTASAKRRLQSICTTAIAVTAATTERVAIIEEYSMELYHKKSTFNDPVKY